MTGHWSDAPDFVHEVRAEVGTNEASASFVFASCRHSSLPQWFLSLQDEIHGLKELRMTDDEDFAIWLAGQLADKTSAELRELRLSERKTWLSTQLARAARLLLRERGEIGIDDDIPLSHLLTSQRKAARRDKQAAPKLVRSICQERLQWDHRERPRIPLRD